MEKVRFVLLGDYGDCGMREIDSSPPHASMEDLREHARLVQNYRDQSTNKIGYPMRLLLQKQRIVTTVEEEEEVIL